MKRRVVPWVLASLLCAGQAAGQAQRPDLTARVEALEKQLAALSQAAAASGTASAAVQELSTKVSALEQAALALGRQNQSHPALVARADELERRVAAAEATANGLATRLGDIEQPAAASGSTDRDGGFRLATGDGRTWLRIGGYLQPRLRVDLSDQFDSVDAASFALRRARLTFDGAIEREQVTYRVMLDGADPETALLDGHLDVAFRPELALRLGRAKVPYTRQWLTEPTRLVFVERPAALDDLRYDRDEGAWLHGTAVDGRIGYVVGVSNGGGAGTRNDNIDFVAAARVDAALIGERFEGYGDLARGDDLRVMIGLGAVHDLVRLPAEVGGVAVGERDVDQDGVGDNVRVVSGSVDVVARVRGFELAIESYFRQERWGTILEHSSNADLLEAIGPSSVSRSGRRNMLGGAAEVSYLVLPSWLVAARVAHSRLSLLGVGGQVIEARPPGDRLFELELASQLLEDGHRSLGVEYGFFNFNKKEGREPADDKQHRFIVEYQWLL